MRYSIQVDELVLHGFGPVDRDRISAGLNEELARLLGSRGLPAGLADRDRLDAGSMDLAPGDDRATGRNLARTVHAGLRA